jgi:hypothetical protein
VVADQAGDALKIGPDAVTHDQQEEPALGEVSTDGVDEAGFHVGTRGWMTCFEDSLPDRPGIQREGVDDGLLQVLIGHVCQRRGVVDDLADHLPAGLGVPPQLGLDDGDLACRRHEQVVDEPDRQGDLSAERHQGAPRPPDLVDREQVRMPVEQLLEPRLGHLPVVLGDGNGTRATAPSPVTSRGTPESSWLTATS